MQEYFCVHTKTCTIRWKILGTGPTQTVKPTYGRTTVISAKGFEGEMKRENENNKSSSSTTKRCTIKRKHDKLGKKIISSLNKMLGHSKKKTKDLNEFAEEKAATTITWTTACLAHKRSILLCHQKTKLLLFFFEKESATEENERTKRENNMTRSFGDQLRTCKMCKLNTYINLRIP